MPDRGSAGDGALLSSQVRPGIILPKGTPSSIVRYLEQAIKTAMQDPDHVRRMREAGLMLKYMGADECAQVIERETTRAKSLVELYRK